MITEYVDSLGDIYRFDFFTAINDKVYLSIDIIKNDISRGIAEMGFNQLFEDGRIYWENDFFNDISLDAMQFADRLAKLMAFV